MSAPPPSPPSPRASTAASPSPGVPDKVVVRLKATGSAPILKQTFFKISAPSRFGKVINFLRKELGFKQRDSLFVYINSSFAPSPDETVANLYRCFAIEGNLIVNYSVTPAWG
ncbi:Ubiquitin-like protein [Polyrhizophydium stewartii]|uniref:Ubiquitin-like protein ATG12 n=1 Tax=Polyrhizophydium stewartii TaxID=2732419 RepID=A0ABR4NCV5_9FUNG